MRRFARVWMVLGIGLFACGLVQAESRLYTWDQALQEAAFRNPQILAAQTGLETAKGIRLAYHARALPKASLNVPMGYRGRRGSQKSKPYFYMDGQITQPLFDYTIPASLRRGDIEGPLALQNIEQVTIEQLHATRMAFIQALTAREVLEIYHVQSGRLQRNVAAQQARFDAGQIGIREVKQAQSQAESLQASLAMAHKDYVVALTTLCRLMGRDQSAGRAESSGPDIGLDGELKFTDLEIDFAGEVKRALAHRSDLNTLRMFVERARIDRTLAESGRYPSLSLVAGGRYVPTDTFTPNTQTIRTSSVQTEYRIGANLSWRVVDFGTTRGPVLRQDKLVEYYDILRLRLESNIAREIAGIRNNYEQARGRYRELKGVEATGLEALNLIEDQIQNGRASQLDYAFTQNEYLDALLNLTRAKAATLIAAADLDRATGRYLAAAREEAPTSTRKP